MKKACKKLCVDGMKVLFCGMLCSITCSVWGAQDVRRDSVITGPTDPKALLQGGANRPVRLLIPGSVAHVSGLIADATIEHTHALAVQTHYKTCQIEANLAGKNAFTSEKKYIQIALEHAEAIQSSVLLHTLKPTDARAFKDTFVIPIEEMLIGLNYLIPLLSMIASPLACVDYSIKHSDFIKLGMLLGNELPRISGHEFVSEEQFTREAVQAHVSPALLIAKGMGSGNFLKDHLLATSEEDGDTLEKMRIERVQIFSLITSKVDGMFNSFKQPLIHTLSQKQPDKKEWIAYERWKSLPGHFRVLEDTLTKLRSIDLRQSSF